MVELADLPPPTHLVPFERDLLRRFITEHGNLFESLDFNVRVGGGRDVPPGVEPQFEALWKKLTQKRIDAVGFRPGQVWILEFKGQAGLAALGQTLGYVQLYQRQFRPGSQIVPAIITDLLGPDDEFLFATNGVRIFIV